MSDLTHEWINEKSFRADGKIPKISDSTLSFLYEKYKPLVLHDDNEFYRIKENPNLRTVSYVWDPVLEDRVRFEVVGQFEAVFPCGYHGFFKPSVAEVLAQFPVAIVMDSMEVNAFFIDHHIKIFNTGSAQAGLVMYGKATKI